MEEGRRKGWGGREERIEGLGKKANKMKTQGKEKKRKRKTKLHVHVACNTS